MSWYVDTHCHLDLYKDPVRVLDQAPGTVVVAVSELPSQYRMLHARFRGDKRVRAALGLHPLQAAAAGRLEEGHLIRQLANVEYVGEVGLDFSPHGKSTAAAQLRVFERLLAEPALRHKVVTVHSRGAEADTIQRLSQARVMAILHWYTGPPRQVDDALAAGMYFSINPAMLRTKKGQALLHRLPRESVLTESDGPFAKARGREAQPSDMPWLVAELARLWGDTAENVQRAVSDNLAALYAHTVGAGELPHRT
jgi:TatD DNase family protein